MQANVGKTVIYVESTGVYIPGIITSMVGEQASLVVFSESNASALFVNGVQHSVSGEPGTWHYPDEN